MSITLPMRQNLLMPPVLVAILVLVLALLVQALRRAGQPRHRRLGVHPQAYQHRQPILAPAALAVSPRSLAWLYWP